MTSTFTTNKRLELPANGDYVNTWNIPVNGDMSVIDQAFGGVTSLNATAGNATLTYTQYRSLFLSVTGSISADVTYTIPAAVGGQWVVINNTTGGFYVKIASGGAGTVASVAPSTASSVGCDGTNAFIVVADSTVPTGGGTNKAFYLNDTSITTNYTVPTGQNAGTFGPVTIAAGVTVTVLPTSYWSIV